MIAQGLRPESHLIVCVASPYRQRDEIADALKRCGNWDAVVHAASVNKVLHQLAVVLKTEDLMDHVPPAFRALIQSLVRHAAFQDQRSVAILAEIVAAFERANIPLMLLKGLGLSERLYPQPFERMSIDVDVLTPLNRKRQAGEVLHSLGYHPTREEFYEGEHFHVPYRRDQSPAALTVELHWQVTKKHAGVFFDVEQWWNDARRFSLRSGDVLLPPPVDEFLYVCHHSFVTGAITLRDLVDISRLSRSVAGDLDQTGSSDVDLFWRQAIALASRLWSVEVSQLPPAHLGSRWRQWLARNVTDVRTVLELGDATWWPFRRICYWSMLEPQRSSFGELVHKVLGTGSSVAAEDGPLKKGLRLCSLGLALGFCLLPYPLFPTRFRHG